MADRHEKGLYFNYDQKYSHSYCCPGHFLLFIAKDDDVVGSGVSEFPSFDSALRESGTLVGSPDQSAQIKLHAPFGTRALRRCDLWVKLAPSDQCFSR